MTWFDKLKDFVNINLHLNITIINNARFNCNNTSEKVEYDPETKSLSLNLKKITDEEKRLLKPVMREAIESDKVLLEDASEYLIENIRANESSQQNRELLAFFHDKIPPEDYHALRAALYVRKRYREGATKDEIYKLKGDILKRFGRRGLNINNLCSLGYFEKNIQPLYEAVSSEEDFGMLYEIIVKEAACTVFVSEEMSHQHVREALLFKMRKCSGYGIKSVSIHGIGASNVEMIKEVIFELGSENPFIKKLVSERKNVISITIWF